MKIVQKLKLMNQKGCKPRNHRDSDNEGITTRKTEPSKLAFYIIFQAGVVKKCKSHRDSEARTVIQLIPVPRQKHTSSWRSKISPSEAVSIVGTKRRLPLQDFTHRCLEGAGQALVFSIRNAAELMRKSWLSKAAWIGDNKKADI